MTPALISGRVGKTQGCASSILLQTRDLREKIAAETTGVHNVILALAFGAMSTQKGSATDS